MNLQEFAALKEGDEVECLMNNSKGTVSALVRGGVRVRWGDSSVDFTYALQSTSWMHWSKVVTWPVGSAESLEK